MSQYILAFDQGTTSSRAIVFDRLGNIKSVAQKEFTQIFPQPGWVEHDASEIWSTQLGVAAEAVIKAHLSMKDIAAIGITNQRETTVLWDRQTGQPLHHAIVWQDRRTAGYCDQLKQEGRMDAIRQKTGLVIDAYFSGTKLKWLLDHVPGARARAEKGELCFGTIDCWLLWKLTNGKVHATDVSNASRTLLYNIHTLAWDEELLELMQIPASVLPEVKSSSEVYGYTDHGGAVVQWLRDGLKIIRSSAEVEGLATQVAHTDGVYLVPAFAGLGAPHWNQHARGTLLGLSRGTSDAHIARAALESIAYQTMDVLKAMEADAGISIRELRVDGGATANDLLMQFQSDMLNTKVVRPSITETTALGAAYLAGLAVGYWKDIDEIAELWQINKEFQPLMSEAQRNHLTRGWNRAVSATIHWANDDNQ